MGDMVMRACEGCGCQFDRMENNPPFEVECKICKKLGDRSLVKLIKRLAEQPR